MNFLEQSTPLTPKKRSSGLHAKEGSISSLERSQRRDRGLQQALSSPTTSSGKSRTPLGSPSKTPTHSDRFIPNRFDENETSGASSPARNSSSAETNNTFKSEVLKQLQQSPTKKMLSFSNTQEEEMSPMSPNFSLKRTLNSCHSPKLSSPKKKTMRVLPSAPSKILDAPGLRDDYYLNLLSWGSNNTIAIALHNAVYLWNASNGHIEQLLELEESDNYVTSVQWSQADNTLAVGTNGNIVEIWDGEKLVKVRELSGHTGRVSSLSWHSNQVLSSGGRDSAILNHDLRQNRHVQSTYLGHQQEVCGLTWSPDGTTLASGGNENLLCIWDAAMSSGNSRSSSSTSTGGSFGNNHRILNQSSNTPRFQITHHQAAVKALSWCPWQRGVLASGGGTADRSIRLWNSALGSNLTTIDTGSQVCAMQWSEPHRELVSSHGFSDNQLCLWKPSSNMSTLNKIREFKSHTARVLHLAKSPDGSSVVSAGADESLRFWDIFNTEHGRTGGSDGRSASLKAMGISQMSSLSGLGGMSVGGHFSVR